MEAISRENLQYLAGFFDGEGCISLGQEGSRNNRNGYSYHPAVRLTNTNKEIIYWLKEITKIGVITDKIGIKPSDKNFYIWSLRQEEITPFLLIIKPYLKIKKPQADLLLEFMNLPRYPIGGYQHRFLVIPEKEIILRQVIFEELRDLNKRGK